MIRIAICDDEKVYADLIYNYINRIITKSSVSVSIMKYNDAHALIKENSIHTFDIMFLDIDMPKVSGFDISKVIRETSSQTYIVFVSAKHELVYSSFEYNPFYFICKTNPKTLYRELDHVLEKLMMHFQQNRKIIINDTAQGKIIIKLQDVLYIKSDKHYLQYFVVNRSDPYLERGTINDVSIKLSCPDFMKPHQRYLVNMNHISKYGGMINTIVLDNNQNVPISKTYKDQAMQSYMVYKRR